MNPFFKHGKSNHPLIYFRLLLFFALTLVSINHAYAQTPEPPPTHLGESTDVTSNGDTYRFHFTTTCAPNDPECDCDDIIDDVDENGTIDAADYDQSNSCLADTDTNGDGIFDEAPDNDGDGIPNVVDLDWSDGGNDLYAESLAYNLSQTLAVYDSWDLLAPGLAEDPNDESRGIWVYRVPEGYVGVLRPSTDRIDMGASYVQRTNLDPRQTLAHEMWHAVQNAYGAVDSAPGDWFLEGQAAMVPDRIWDEVDTLEGSAFVNKARNYLSSPNNPLPVDVDNDGETDIDQAHGLLGASYRAALWWAYLAEQAGTEFAGAPAEGIDFLRAVLEKNLQPFGGTGWNATNTTIQERTGSNFTQTFWDFSIANYAHEFDLSLLSSAALNGRDPEQVLKYRDEGTQAENLDYGQVYRDVVDANGMNTQTSGTADAIVPLVDDLDGMPDFGVKYYEGLLPPPDECPVAFWRVDGIANAALMHSFLMLEDRNNNGELEVTLLDRHQGDFFSRTVVNRSEYRRIAGIVTTGRSAHGFDWQIGCDEPNLAIVLPTASRAAAVGTPGNLGSFLVWVEVTGSDDNPLIGLDGQNNFAVTLIDSIGQIDPNQQTVVEAEIINSGMVQNQQWLLVQAPEIPGAAEFDIFDVQVELIGTDANDTNNLAVLYGTESIDQVLLIDRSASMKADEKFVSAQIAAGLYIDTAQQNDQLGIVSYNESATSNFGLTLIPDQNDDAGLRTQARNIIDNLAAEGNTAIGDAMSRGQNMLTANGVTDRQWMVLLSDGNNTAGSDPRTVLNTHIPEDTDIHTIALGSDADLQLMYDIAAQTCPPVYVDHCYHVLNTDGTPVQASAMLASELPTKLTDLYRRISENIANHQRLWQGNGSGDAEIEISLPATRGGDALLSIGWACDDNSINVTAPSGVDLIERRANTHAIYYIPELTRGEYSIQLEGDCGWTGSLSAYVTEGVRMHAFIDTPAKDRIAYVPAQLQVSLHDEKGPITGAKLTATAYHPDGTQEQLVLRDDGIGPHDDAAGDGIYGYTYDRIDSVEPQNYAFDIVAQGDGFTRYQQLTYRSTFVNPDADGDGLIDVWQERYGVKLASSDPDFDQLTNLEEQQLKTDPLNSDSDGGGESDRSEVDAGRDPRNAEDDALPILTDFWCQNEQGAVKLHFDKREEFDEIRIWRVDRATDGVPMTDFVSIGDFSAKDGFVFDSGLSNGANYLYVLQALRNRTEGGYTMQKLCQPDEDPYPPNSELTINDGNPTTDSEKVRLRMTQMYDKNRVPEITHVKLSNTPDIHNAKWVPFSTEMEWKVEPHPKTGLATVYALFLDDSGNVSETSVTGSIRLVESNGPTFGTESEDVFVPLMLR